LLFIDAPPRLSLFVSTRLPRCRATAHDYDVVAAASARDAAPQADVRARGSDAACGASMRRKQSMRWYKNDTSTTITRRGARCYLCAVAIRASRHEPLVYADEPRASASSA